ncbi:MAG: glycosyltransferase family 2 protein [Caldisphaeraceae archaeon]|nr:glycosyltransferase family 2 protein [Caldisphaeraceae archaeon]MEB3798445.1 glycosyltransferase family 2 protein [Caldisphaeraceae archaeon]
MRQVSYILMHFRYKVPKETTMGMLLGRIVASAISSIIALSITAIMVYGIFNIRKSMNSFHIINACNGRQVNLIIPARNEEENIKEMLDKISSINGLVQRVIVINDRSEDKTGLVAKGFKEKDKRVEVIDIKEVPNGWLPKPYALTRGSLMVPIEGSMLFLDADIKGDYDKLIKMSSCTKEGELISFMPRFKCDSILCNSTQSLLSALLHGYFGYNRSLNEEDAFTLIFGCCFSIRPYTYKEVGGHAIVKGELVEDKEFASVAKSKKVKIIPVDARDFIETKSWQGFDSIRNFMARLFYSYARKSSGSHFYLFLAGLSLLFYFPLAFIPLLIFKLYLASSITLASYIVENLFVYIGGLTNKIKGPYSLLYFIASLSIMLGLMDARRKGFKWKGNYYSSKNSISSLKRIKEPALPR